MTLGFASAVTGAPAKRVQNACAVLNRGFQYSIDDMRRLGLAFWLVDSFVMELKWAWEFAGQALKDKNDVVRFGHPGGPVLEIDVGRFLSDFALASASALKDPPRTVGRRAHDRPPRARNAIKAAREFGIDIDALEEGLKRTPEERLRSLNENWRFLREVRVSS
ncbi:MAG TPA: hypothetical protein VNX15_02860 [Gemmatimonadales bacterium]|jgi:hypothetical protein|nr:hypothetical protein [Gemmatimonadales bacterium]